MKRLFGKKEASKGAQGLSAEWANLPGEAGQSDSPDSPDAPQGPGGHDSLGRRPFARAIADLVINAPAGVSFRVGVYGGWGEGKTSALRFIEGYLTDGGCVCVRFSPIAARSVGELRRRIISAVSKKLDLPISSFGSGILNLAFKAREGAREAEWWAKMADAALGDLIESKFDEWLHGTFLPALRKTLSDHKLVIFVDDLDRVRAELLPDFLLTLREALDLEGAFYVLGLAPDVVTAGLEAQNVGWGGSHRFLEKVVEYPRFLPTPSGDELNRFVTAELERVRGSVDVDALNRVLPYLPPNPRRIKLFLRFLSLLKPTIDRFSPDELPVSTLYMIELLRAEYPDLARSLAHDEKVLDKIENAHFANLLKTKGDVAPVERPEAKLIVDTDVDRDRFFAMCDELRKVEWSGHSLKALFSFGDRPPLLSRKEFAAFAEGYVADSAMGLDAMRSWASIDGGLNVDRVRLLWRYAVKLRDHLIDMAVDQDSEADTIAGVALVHPISRLLLALLNDWKLVRDGVLSVNEWALLYGQIVKWSRWHVPTYYKPLRQEELALFGALTQEMKTGLRRAVRLWLVSHGIDEDERVSEQVSEATNALRHQLDKTIADELLSAFERPDGLAALDDELREYLVFPEGLFHSTAYRERLRVIAERSKNEATVHSNFVRFLRLLQAGATEPLLRLNEAHCKQLLKDHSFVEWLWHAATARPLNRRVLGSLRELRRLAADSEQEADKLMPLPASYGASSPLDAGPVEPF